MDLVPVMKADASAASAGHMHSSVEMPGASAAAAPQKPSEFTVPVERQQMIGVTYATAERRPLEATLRTVGIVEPEAERVFEYVARVDGYVDKLAVSSPGQMVKKGEALLTIYSPDLLATEQELLEMLRTSGSADRLFESAKRRLKLWNVSDEDIDQLLKTRKASEFLTLRSPFDGIVGNVSVKPGMSVKVGDRLMGLVDLSAVWLWAEFYENELPLLSPGQKLKITVPAFGDEEFGGEIAVIEPFLDPSETHCPCPDRYCEPAMEVASRHVRQRLARRTGGRRAYHPRQRGHAHGQAQHCLRGQGRRKARAALN